MRCETKGRRALSTAALAVLLLAGCTGAPSTDAPDAPVAPVTAPRAATAGSSPTLTPTATAEPGETSCAVTRSTPEPMEAGRATTAEQRAKETVMTADPTTNGKPGRYETATFALG